MITCSLQGSESNSWLDEKLSNFISLTLEGMNTWDTSLTFFSPNSPQGHLSTADGRVQGWKLRIQRGLLHTEEPKSSQFPAGEPVSPSSGAASASETERGSWAPGLSRVKLQRNISQGQAERKPDLPYWQCRNTGNPGHEPSILGELFLLLMKMQSTSQCYPISR